MDEAEEEAVEDKVDLKDKGVEVNGGGKGAPFRSPFTLRLRGGSSKAVFSFFRLPFAGPSFPPDALARALC